MEEKKINYLILLIGVALGVVLTLLFFYHKSGYGYFTVVPYDDEDTGFYNINVRIPTQGDLSKKKRIIIYKEEQSSQK